MSKDSKKLSEPEESPVDELDAIEPEVIEDLVPSEVEGDLPFIPEADIESGLIALSDSKDLARSDPLQRYLAEIRSTPTLTKEEEHELAVRYFKLADKQAGYKLVMANLRLVVMIAREYQRNVQNVLDLVQEGNLGLLEAVKHYDPFRGIRFPSYAVYWVRAYMLRYLINNLRLVKIGTTQAQRKLFFNLQKEKDKLEAEGFVPEAKLLAERLNVKESEVIDMEQRLALPDLSVDAPISGDEEDGGDYHNLLADSGLSAEDQIVDGQFSRALRSAVEEFKLSLSDKEQAIVDLRLFTETPATLQDIAERFDLSRERIRQLESRLKERLKVYLVERLQLGSDGEVMIEGDDRET